MPWPQFNLIRVLSISRYNQISILINRLTGTALISSFLQSLHLCDQMCNVLVVSLGTNFNSWRYLGTSLKFAKQHHVFFVTLCCWQAALRLLSNGTRFWFRSNNKLYLSIFLKNIYNGFTMENTYTTDMTMQVPQRNPAKWAPIPRNSTGPDYMVHAIFTSWHLHSFN